MFSNHVYIAENPPYTELNDADLKNVPQADSEQSSQSKSQFISSENLPEVKATTANTQMPSELVVPNVTQQNYMPMVITLGIICILIVILSMVYQNIRKKTQARNLEIYRNQLRKKKTEKLKNENSNVSENTTENAIVSSSLSKENDVGSYISPYVQDENESSENLSNLKLGTPSSVENCVKNFLEITSE